MDCPNIDQLGLSTVSKSAIEDIRDKLRFSRALVYFTGIGTMASIFAGNGHVEANYSLYSTDFELMTKALVKVPNITKRSIETVANNAWFNVSSREEKQFWEAVSNGCKVNF